MIISTLHTHPHFADTVAHRGWHAWWTERDCSRVAYRAGLDPMIGGSEIPQGYVAHEGETYLARGWTQIEAGLDGLNAFAQTTNRQH